MSDRKTELEKLLQADNYGYGDPEARANDDRKIQIFLAQQQWKIQKTLNWLTGFLVVVGIINILVLVLK